MADDVKVNNAYVENAQVMVSSHVVLPVVKVWVNQNFNTGALLDTGSTNSFCTQRLIDALGIKGQDVSYRLNTLNSSNDVSRSKLVNLKLMSIDSKQCLEMTNVYVVQDIPALNN